MCKRRLSSTVMTLTVIKCDGKGALSSFAGFFFFDEARDLRLDGVSSFLASQ